MNITSILRTSQMLVLLMFSHYSLAGIQVAGTRVIFPSAEREASIQVRNMNAEDIMIQSWIEPTPGQPDSNIPFAITPSLARLGGMKQQMLRIFYQGVGLPQDRESVFWLNIQEIPQLSGNENSLQVAFRQRLKVFYRPAKLPGTPAEAAKNLRWTVQGNTGKASVKVTNDTAFYISLTGAKLTVGQKEYTVKTDMIKPYSSEIMKVNGNAGAIDGNMNMNWESINDYGAPIKHSAPVHF
jgi:P pilus assembly chaperone PapD